MYTENYAFNVENYYYNIPEGELTLSRKMELKFDSFCSADEEEFEELNSEQMNGFLKDMPKQYLDIIKKYRGAIYFAVNVLVQNPIEQPFCDGSLPIIDIVYNVSSNKYGVISKTNELRIKKYIKYTSFVIGENFRGDYFVYDGESVGVYYLKLEDKCLYLLSECIETFVDRLDLEDKYCLGRCCF
jgi:hypothetical protein